MIRAAIAIGSNSTRMLTADKAGETLIPLLRGREETRLFMGLDDSGRIRPERLEETARAVARLALQARQAGAQSISLFATSATRDAQNGQALADRIRALCGLSMRVISGEEEARLAFLAVSQGQRRLVMDVGGGSTEWTVGENNQVEWQTSMQLGSSRLLKMGAIQSLSDAERMLDTVRGIIAPAAQRLRACAPAPKMIGLGGACTTSAAMTMGHEAHGESVEGKTILLQTARDQLRLLASIPLEERMRVPGLPPARAVHMPHGLCILIAAMEASGFSQLTVSGKTNLDGYLMTLQEEDITKEEPPCPRN